MAELNVQDEMKDHTNLERAVWEEASKFAYQFVFENRHKALSYGKGKQYQWQRDQYHALADLAQKISREFRRRASQAEGKGT